MANPKQNIFFTLFFVLNFVSILTVVLFFRFGREEEEGRRRENELWWCRETTNERWWWWRWWWWFFSPAQSAVRAVRVHDIDARSASRTEQSAAQSLRGSGQPADSASRTRAPSHRAGKGQHSLSTPPRRRCPQPSHQIATPWSSPRPATRPTAPSRGCE